MRILIADSHPPVVEQLTPDLRELAPEAVIAGTSDIGDILRLCEEECFHVIFLEIELPEINGIELSKRILQLYPRTNIIFITAHKEYALESYQIYASAFLLKPLTKDMVRNAMIHLRFPVSNITEAMLESLNAGGRQIGIRLRKCREERGFSREELASLLNVSSVTVFRWETGARIPMVPMLLGIVKVLGAEPNELLGAGEYGNND